MRSVWLPVLVLLTLAACGDPRSAANREASALNSQLRKEAEKEAAQVSVSGKVFEVAVISGGAYQRVATDSSGSDYALRRDGRPYALVKRLSPAGAPYTGADIQAAAAQASGCQARFQGGILSAVGGFSGTSTDLGALESKISSGFNGWRADLTC